MEKFIRVLIAPQQFGSRPSEEELQKMKAESDQRGREEAAQGLNRGMGPVGQQAGGQPQPSGSYQYYSGPRDGIAGQLGPRPE